MLKDFFSYLIYLALKIAVRLRYKIKVVEDEKIKKGDFPSSKGILFLPNHPAAIDPLLLILLLWPRFRPHPIAVDFIFQKPFLGALLRRVGALSVPNFEDSSNSYKRMQIEKTFEKMTSLLKSQENVLVYPSGGLKGQAEEVVGGASGVHDLLKSCPDANVVLIRTTGLWGSSFSRAITGKSPDVIKTFLNGFKTILKNFIFFTPRREVLIELELAPTDFPRTASRRECNHYLEEWYNKKGKEPLKLVSYAFWKRQVPKVASRKKSSSILLDKISEDLKAKVFDEISRLSNIPVEKITFTSLLAQDLGLDSLDQAQLVLFLKENFGVQNLNSSELYTVEDVIAFASGLKKPKMDEEIEEIKPFFWGKEKQRGAPRPPEGETLIEGFLNTAARLDPFIACTDSRSGEFTYRKFKLGVILLALAIRKKPELRIGIMMPASSVVNMMILATMLAKKVPVMINWTLGLRNLESIVESSQIQTCLSSWQFVNKLNNVELNDLNEKLLFVEDIKASFTLKMKLQALALRMKSPQKLLSYFGSNELKGDDDAVILYTSGTENYPKGVPLSHSNILSNQRDAYSYASISPKDVFLGALPPFHSFGFSVTGLLPLLAGIKVAYSPNPTDGRRIAYALETWKVTLLCLAPTFIKNVMRVATSKQLSKLRLMVSGAEKAPEELFEKITTLNPKAQMIEGYGITECGPILTLNPPGRKRRGVGIALPSVKLLIVHPETMEICPVNKEGHILANGPGIFRGYLDPKLPSPFVEISGEKWYKTGDLGFLDEDGYLTLVGRLKRFIKIGGEMISLGAIEEALYEKGTSKGWKFKPDEPAFAVCALENDKKAEIWLFTDFPLTLEEANKVLKESGLSNLIRLSKVVELPLIPLLGTGKIDYHALNLRMKDDKHS